MKKLCRYTLCCFLACAFSSPAQGALVLDITGVPNSGTSTWLFSGDAVANANDEFDNGSPAGADSWNDVGDLFSAFYSTVSTPSTPSGATITTVSGTRNIDELYLDDDGGANDELGFGVDGASPLSFTTGSVVSWSGSFVMNQDVANMNVGTYVDPSPSFGGLDLTVNISATAVPEPSSLLALAGIGIAGYCWPRRRKVC